MTVPKIWKKKAKAEAKAEAKKTVKSLSDALRKEGKKVTPVASNKKVGGPKQPFMSQKFKKPDQQGAASGKQPFMSKKFKKPDQGGGGKKEQQEVKKKDYRATKPNFQLVENLKPVWNKIRERSTPEKIRAELVQRLVKQMTGKVLQVTLRHDASRVVQCIFQYGTKEQRGLILDELVQKLVEISKTPYGHFTVLKAIAYCTEVDERKKIVSALQGSFKTLGCNVIGARTVESIVQLYPPQLVKDLKAEFYGQKFTILLAGGLPKSLGALLEGTSVESGKRSAIIDHMRDLVHRFVDKGLLEFTYVHELLWEYVREVSGEKMRMDDLVALLADSAPKLMSTKPGTRVVCHVVGHSGAKERKRIMKSLKSKVLESLLHDSAHLGIMRIVDVTDDTVSVQKMLLEEIKDTKPVLKYTADGQLIGTPYPPLISVAKHRLGCKLLCRLLAPQTKHLEPDEEPLFVIKEGESRKAAGVKRKEHLAYLKSSLVALSSRYAEDLSRCRSASRALRNVVEVFFPEAVINALVAVFSGKSVETVDMPVDEDDEEGDEDDDDDEEEDDEDEDDDEEQQKGKGEDMDQEDQGEQEKEEGDWGDDDDLEADDEDAILKPAAANKNKGAAVLPPPAPLLPIHEDPVAHQLLKQLLQLEAAAEIGSGKAGGEMAALDDSLWEKSASAPDRVKLALPLFQAISSASDSSSLGSWIACNRGCYAIAAMIQVPSAKQAILKALGPASPHAAALKAAAAKGQEGAKQLVGLVGEVSKPAAAKRKA